MFVTLSRRNTSLINQQLGLIETLESDEEDPQRLESLFRLDHLAARMRRNAESLVILSGAPGRATEHDDLALTDVLQAAIAGVQDYQRVQLDAAPAQRVSGEAAADVVHLLSELVDNALSYSPPSSKVLVTSSFTRGGGHRPGHRRRARHRRRRPRRDQREAALRRRGHPRDRPPDGPVRGQPAGRAARPDGPAGPERPDGHHRHDLPAHQRAQRHRAPRGRLRLRCRGRRCPGDRPGRRHRLRVGHRRRGGRRFRRCRRRRLPPARPRARGDRPDHRGHQRLRTAPAASRCLGRRHRRHPCVDGRRLLRADRARRGHRGPRPGRGDRAGRRRHPWVGGGGARRRRRGAGRGGRPRGRGRARRGPHPGRG